MPDRFVFFKCIKFPTVYNYSLQYGRHSALAKIN